MTPHTAAPSILKSLRALTPQRRCTFDEALNVAERQATRLGDLVLLADPNADGIDLRHIGGLPRVRVVFEQLPIGGMSHWNGREWIIAIARGDSAARQRFTLLHEFKHIVDHGQAHLLYTGDGRCDAADQAERAADYFAGCALVPRRDLKRVWGNRVQRTADLASHFGVSEQAMLVRLDQTGLSRSADYQPIPRCARPLRTAAGHTQRFRIARPGYAKRYA
jgi:Zn-dependent peptidase ImmA (M78 family)